MAHNSRTALGVHRAEQARKLRLHDIQLSCGRLHRGSGVVLRLLACQGKRSLQCLVALQELPVVGAEPLGSPPQPPQLSLAALQSQLAGPAPKKTTVISPRFYIFVIP
jgi:hypothetical protein